MVHSILYGMSNKESLSSLLEKQSQELRRGALVLATLSQLKQARYGYALIEQLGERGLVIDQGTLYPLLRRLEEQGLLQSQWKIEESRPRRYYSISAKGEELLQALLEEWRELAKVMDNLLKDGE